MVNLSVVYNIGNWITLELKTLRERLRRFLKSLIPIQASRKNDNDRSRFILFFFFSFNAISLSNRQRLTVIAIGRCVEWLDRKTKCCSSIRVILWKNVRIKNVGKNRPDKKRREFSRSRNSCEFTKCSSFFRPTISWAELIRVPRDFRCNYLNKK